MPNYSKVLLLPSLLLGMAGASGAQQPSAADTAPVIPAIGDVAPDFVFRAVTKDSLASKPAKLSDYRGQTVVLWFFIKARTRG